MAEKTVTVVGSGTLGLAFTVTGSCMAALARNPSSDGRIAAENPRVELAAGDVLVRANGGAAFSAIGGCDEGGGEGGELKCSQLLAALRATKLRCAFLRSRPDLSNALSDGEIASAIIAEYDPSGSGRIQGDARARFTRLVVLATIEHVGSLTRPLTLVFRRPSPDRAAVPPLHDLIRLGLRANKASGAEGNAKGGEGTRAKTSKDGKQLLLRRAARQRRITAQARGAMFRLRSAIVAAEQSFSPSPSVATARKTVLQRHCRSRTVFLAVATLGDDSRPGPGGGGLCSAERSGRPFFYAGKSLG